VEKCPLFAQNYAQRFSGYPEKKRPVPTGERAHGNELKRLKQAKTCYQQKKKQNTS